MLSKPCDLLIVVFLYIFEFSIGYGCEFCFV
jgi:hypothetical protein